MSATAVTTVPKILSDNCSKHRKVLCYHNATMLINPLSISHAMSQRCWMNFQQPVWNLVSLIHLYVAHRSFELLAMSSLPPSGGAASLHSCIESYFVKSVATSGNPALSCLTEPIVHRWLDVPSPLLQSMILLITADCQ